MSEFAAVRPGERWRFGAGCPNTGQGWKSRCEEWAVNLEGESGSGRGA